MGFKDDIQSKVNLGDSIAQCKKAGFDASILDQVRSDGTGSDLLVEADILGGDVRVINLMTFMYSHRLGYRAINFLLDIFPQVEMLEQCGDFFKLRVPKEGKTIGWLFGHIESSKKELGVQEYSISQTTLE